MANIKSAKKRARQAEANRQRNAGRKTMMRTYIKRVLKAILAGDVAKAREEFKLASSVIDRLSKTIVHHNTAARYKSRLAAKIKALDLSKAAK